MSAGIDCYNSSFLYSITSAVTECKSLHCNYRNHTDHKSVDCCHPQHRSCEAQAAWSLNCYVVTQSCDLLQGTDARLLLELLEGADLAAFGQRLSSQDERSRQGSEQVKTLF